MRKLLLLLSILVLFGCPAKIPPVVEIAPGQYQIPVAHDKIEPPAGWEDSRAVMEITVPPSDKPTTVFVRPKERSIIHKLFPSRNETTSEAVSDNKDVKTKQESKTPWWWWVLGGTAGLGAVWIFAGKYLGPVFKVFGGAGKLIMRIFKR